MSRLFYIFIILFIGSSVFAQSSARPNSGEVYQKLERLNFLGSVLYFAAHPDDENTRLISYLSNAVHANTAYLSLTRGDGGQNLIGNELREELGVLRTNELLMAREIDGGTQYFSRANDFGYSKHPDETFDIWNEDEVLSDAIWVIRKFQPDVIINRFNHRTPGTTHGHHTASAILSLEAMEKSADKNVFPEQLKFTETWQPKRAYYNTSWWAYPGETRAERRENFEKADKSQLVRVDIGTYDPVSGSSLSEIAIRSRSKHLSQGFGAIPWRGSTLDYLEPIVGDPIVDNTNVFDGINTSWSRVKGGAAIGKKVEAIIAGFDFTEPGNSIPALQEVRSMIEQLEDGYWKRVKLQETSDLIEAATGLFVEFIVDEHKVSPGETVKLNYEIVNRSQQKVELVNIEIDETNFRHSERASLAYNESMDWEKELTIPQDCSYTAPYWLENEWSIGMYDVPAQELRGLPMTPHPLKVRATFEVNGKTVTLVKDLVHKYRDPAKGEIYRPFEITPAVFASFDRNLFLFSDAAEKEIKVSVLSGKENVSGSVGLDLPKGWSAKPASRNFDLALKGASQELSFTIKPSKDLSIGKISAVATVAGKEYTQSVVDIEYDHVPHQSILLPASAKIVRVPLERGINKVAYINGAGDKMPASLRAVGYEVDVFEIEDVNAAMLARYEAVILGVRIYNVKRKEIALAQEELFAYVENGGTLVTQYNTSWGLDGVKVAPYDLKLSRDRITDENAAVTVLAPEHRVMNSPNKIEEADFENWVQERGLYFPNEWSEEFTAILSAADKGEEQTSGGLLIAKHGKGHFVYSGISWFRVMPAGVPGAYRLFANILALGDE